MSFYFMSMALYVTEVDSYIYIYQNLKITIFMIYKAPDVQSTSVKHDNSMVVICPENIR